MHTRCMFMPHTCWFIWLRNSLSSWMCPYALHWYSISVLVYYSHIASHFLADCLYIFNFCFLAFAYYKLNKVCHSFWPLIYVTRSLDDLWCWQLSDCTHLIIAHYITFVVNLEKLVRTLLVVNMVQMQYFLFPFFLLSAHTYGIEVGRVVVSLTDALMVHSTLLRCWAQKPEE